MKTQHQDSQRRTEGWRRVSPVNLTGKFKISSPLWSQRHPRPRTCPDGTTLEPAESLHVLHEIFEAQTDARPGPVAVMFDWEDTTYADLEAPANRLARHLRSRGVQRGSLVAMLLPRSAAAYAALLGILKAGAAYVPLDDQDVDHITPFVLKQNQAVGQRRRFSQVRFGSQVDLIVPLSPGSTSTRSPR